jgi:hypothetical protein
MKQQPGAKPQPLKPATITTFRHHGLEPGDWIYITQRDTRWWRRLWFRLLGRGEPQRTVTRQVASVDGRAAELRKVQPWWRLRA